MKHRFAKDPKGHNGDYGCTGKEEAGGVDCGGRSTVVCVVAHKSEFGVFWCGHARCEKHTPKKKSKK